MILLNTTIVTTQAIRLEDWRAEGYAKEMIFGEFGDLIASVVGGGSTTYWCDYFYTNIGSNALRGVLFGGTTNAGVRAGFGCAYTYYAPRIRLRMSADVQLTPGNLPAGIMKDDPNFGPTEIYQAPIDWPIQVRGGQRPFNLTLAVRYQGCASQGICYPPEIALLTVTLPAAAAPAGGWPSLILLPSRHRPLMASVKSPARSTKACSGSIC